MLLNGFLIIIMEYIFQRGTHQKIYYNTNHEECGQLCQQSPREPLNVRCLSFDFFEFPSLALPTEIENNGVCILNSGNRDSARLRNVDQGYTDEELFSNPAVAGHYRLRLSNLGGHYMVRNPRGGQIAEQLDYAQVTPEDQYKIYIWAGSRWGIAHIPPWDGSKAPQTRGPNAVNCSQTPEPTPKNTTQLTYYGGYTPVGLDQKCVGRLNKANAILACESTGGQLCPNQQIAKSLEGRKIGCSYDGDPVWSAEDIPSPPQETRFARCCAKYSYPNFCAQSYSQSTINFCSQRKTFHDCQYQGTGYARQDANGFGLLLESYRTACVNSKYKSNMCTKAMVQDWAPRDRCIWCLEPGTGRGQCRAGNDFGICRDSDQIARDRFANIVNVMCGTATTCRLAKAYPDIDCMILGKCDPIPDPNEVACASFSGNITQCNAYPNDCTWVPANDLCVAQFDGSA